MSQGTKLKPVATRETRDPPPSLFLGPTPSQNASLVSLTGTLAPTPTNASNLSTSRAPLIRQLSQLSTRMPARNIDGQPDPTVGNALPRNRQKQDSEVKKQADRTDALWAEMQGTLEEVELSATNGAHVFGPDHSRALEGLRAAQIQLAQAWARSEADDAVESTVDKESKALGSKIGGTVLGSDGLGALDTLETDGGMESTAPSGASGMAAAEKMGSKLAEETESDILLARKRREANDRYFQRVNDGVLDVVAKLEQVASAMLVVEQESRDIWGESGSTAESLSG
jgi:septum formation topological specificity factor MinE